MIAGRSRLACALLAIVLLAACATQGASHSSRGLAADRAARITAVAKSEVAAGRLPGVVVLVARDGNVIIDEAIGTQDPVARTPMQKDSIFRIYSMSKPIVSVGVMMLVEEGRIQLTDPVVRHFPEFRELKVGVEKGGADGKPALELVAATRVMTVQDLLRHTSGLTYGVFGRSLVKTEYLKNDVDSWNLDNAELIRRLAKVPLASQPGTTWEYSRSTDVLGALIERVSGQTLDVYLQQRIFGPLKMVDTGFWVEPSKHGRIAEAFAADPETKQAQPMIAVKTRPTYLSGGGGLVSTARDYLRFCQMMLNGGDLDGVRLLSAHTVRLMLSDHLNSQTRPTLGANLPGYGFGLGFAVRVENGQSATPGSIGEGNWGGLGGTYFWIDPQQGLAAIWMTQAPVSRNHYRGLFRNLVYGAMTP